LRRTAVGGAGWNVLSYLGGKALVLASTVILARLLTPDDFGVVGLALVFITYADVLTDLGAAEALIYLPPSRRLDDGALTISLLWSAAVTLVAVAAAPAVARFFHSPAVTPLFRVLALSLLLGGTAQVPDALLRKELQFRRRMVADLGRAVGQGVISVALAMAGLGAWAIVYGYVAGDLVWSAVAWTLVDYRPGRGFWRIQRETIRPLLAFGIPAVGSALLLVLVFNVDYLIVGRRLAAKDLGYYTLAFRVPQTLIIYLFYALSTVAFPMFSRTRDEPDRLKRGYLTSLRIQNTYGAAVGVGIATVAPMLVEVVFGPKWRPAIVPLEAIALYAMFRAFGTGAGDVYKGIGRPRISLWLAIVRLMVLVPALWFAADRAFGSRAIDYVSWVQMVVAFIMAALMQGVAARVIGVSLRQVAGTLRPAVLVAAGTAAGAGAIRLWVRWPDSDPWKLLASITSGAVLGLLLLYTLDREFITEAVGLLKAWRRTSRT
jgi:PST family polysaccharide transporter